MRTLIGEAHFHDHVVDVLQNGQTVLVFLSFFRFST